LFEKEPGQVVVPLDRFGMGRLRGGHRRCSKTSWEE
jgi:hypothetical protein